MQQIQIPPLNEGETYAFSIGDRHGELTHIVLLPGEHPGTSQPDQIAWAQSLGGDLPSLAEQALLREHCPGEFRPVAYWSNRNDGDGWAWCTHFSHGSQNNNPQHDELPARAVRRIKG